MTADLPLPETLLGVTVPRAPLMGDSEPAGRPGWLWPLRLKRLNRGPREVAAVCSQLTLRLRTVRWGRAVQSRDAPLQPSW